MVHISRVLGIGLLAVVLFAVLPAAGADAPADPKADRALEALTARLADPKADRDKLRHDLLAFRLTCPGTPHAVKAAGLLSQLPSPLNKLDPDAIPELERFDWQPKELAAVVGEHRGRHGNPVHATAFSPDGKVIASAGGSYVRLWEPSSMRLRAALGTSAALCLAFNKDGTLLAVGTGHGTIHVWESADAVPKLRFTIAASTTPVPAVAFAPDGKTLAAGCGDRDIRVYDVGDKMPVEKITYGGHEKGVASLAYSPDGKTLVSGSQDHTVRLWDVPGGYTEKGKLEAHKGAVLALAFSPTGGTLATGGGDGAVRVWAFPPAAKAAPRSTAAPPKGGSVTSLAFTPDGKALASGHTDGVVRQWDAAGLKGRPPLEGHQGAVHGVDYSPDGKLLVSGGADWTARTWEVATAKQRFVPWSHLSHVYSAAFTPDGTALASGSLDQIVRVWDLTKPSEKNKRYETKHYLKGDPAAVYQVDVSPDGKKVAAAGLGKKVYQYDLANGRALTSFDGPPGPVHHLAYSPNGLRLLTATDKTAHLWDATNGKQVRAFEGHETPIRSLAYSADGRYALSGSGDYERANGRIVTRDGKPVYTDTALRLWDVDSGRELQKVTSHTVPIYSAAFAPDGRGAATGALEPVLRRWELKDNALAEADPLKGTNSHVNGIAFAPDGTTLVTRGLNHRLILWDAAGGKRLKEWVFSEVVGDVAYAADGRHLAVSLGTGVIYILRLAPVPPNP